MKTVKYAHNTAILATKEALQYVEYFLIMIKLVKIERKLMG